MRLKRICSKTSAGKLQIPEEVHSQWLKGDREPLQLALTRALKVHGFENTHKTRTAVRVWVCPNIFFIVKFKYVCAKDITKHPFVIYEAPFQAEFQEQFTKIREQARMKDEEVEGGWYLEERMEKDLKYSKCLGFFHLFIFF